MKKQILIIASLIIHCQLSIVNCQAQFVKNDWGALIGNGTGSVGRFEAKDIESDASGNVYIVGTLAGTVDFDPSLTVVSLSTFSPNYNRAYLAKYSSNGALIWVKMLGDASQTGFVTGEQLTLDASGDVYIAGQSNGIVDLDPNGGTVLTPANSTWYIAKYDANGSIVWGKSVAAVQYYMVSHLFINANNELVSMNCNDQILTTPIGFTIYNKTTGAQITSYGSSGSNGFTANTINNIDSYKGTQDNNGNYVMCSSFNGVIDLDVSSGVYNVTSNPNGVTNVGLDMFICKYNSSFAIQWAISIGGGNVDNGGQGIFPANVVTDAAGNIYVGGVLADTADFDPGVGVTLLYPGGAAQGFLAKYSPTGNLVWARTISNSPGIAAQEQSIIEDIRISADGNSLYFMGSNSIANDYNPSPNADLIFPIDYGPSNNSIVHFGGILGNVDLNGNILNANMYDAYRYNGSFIGLDCMWISNTGDVHLAVNYIQQGPTIHNPITFGACVNNPYPCPSADGLLGVTISKYSPCSNPPTITSQPQDTVGCQGLPLSINIGISGATCKKYHWMKYGPEGGYNAWISQTDSATLYFPSFGPADPGTYICTVEGECGSISSRVFTIGSREPISMGVQNTPYDVAVCEGTVYTFDFATYTNNVAGENPSYQWKLGNTVLSNTTTATLSNVSPANSGLYWGIASNLCNSDTIYVNLIVNPLPDVSASVSANSFCTGGSVTINTPGVANTTYLLMDANYSVYANTSPFQVSAAGTYYLYASDNATNCSVTSTTALIITENPLPIAAILSSDVDGTLCSGSSATLTATGGTGFAWDNGLGTNAMQTLSPSSGTTYTVDVTDANGCTAQASYTLNVVSNPSVSISTPQTSLCNGSSLMLMAFGADTYAWNNSLGTGDMQTVSPGTTTTYTVTGTDGTYGCTGTASQQITVLPTYNVTATNAICTGSSYQFGSQTLTSGGQYVETFQAANGCDSTVTLTLTVSSTITTSQNASFCQGQTYLLPDGSSTSTAGAYPFNYTTASGCDSTFTLNLTELPTITNSVSTAICNGSTYQFGSQTLTSGGQYVETFQAASGCDSTVTLTLTVSNTITVTANDTFCTGQTFTLPDGSTTTTGGTFPFQYTTTSGCDSTYNVVLFEDICTGIATPKEEVISLYPNPTTGQFLIELPTTGTFQVEVFNTLGQVVYSSTVTNATKHTINIGNAPVGVYNVRVRNEKSSVSKVIIVN